MARIVAGPRGPQVMIEPGDSCYSIAGDLAGDPDRWQELIDANEGRALSELGTFRDMIPGDRLEVPPGWIEFAKSKGIDVPEMGRAPDAGAFANLIRDRESAGELQSLPLFWTKSDVAIVNAMGAMWGGTGDDVLVTFYQESAGSMNPHLVTTFGGKAPDGLPMYEYGGLIGGLGSFWSQGKRIFPIDQTMGWPAGTWMKIVRNSSLSVQLQAIAQVWDKTFRTYLSEPIDRRAERLGVPLHALIHAVNFLPARINALQNADQSITKSTDKDPGTRSGSFYGDNPILDADKDGKITLRDFADFGDQQMQAMANGSKGVLLALARESRVIAPLQSLATLWAPITPEWEDLTGRAPIVSVGYGSQRGAASVGLLIVIAILIGLGWYVWGRK